MNLSNNSRIKSKSRAINPKRRATATVTFEKNASFPVESLKDFKDILQTAKIPTIFVKQVSSMINNYSANSTISMTINGSFVNPKNQKGNNYFFSNSDLNFLSFQKNLANYLANSGINRFSRDFDIKLKSIINYLKNVAPDIAGEISELNVYNKNDFVHRFAKIKGKILLKYNNYVTSSPKKAENRNNSLLNRNTTSISKRNSQKESNYEKVIELFNQIDSQINSNDTVLNALNQINKQINLNILSSSDFSNINNMKVGDEVKKENQINNSFLYSDELSEYITSDYSSPFDPKNNNKNDDNYNNRKQKSQHNHNVISKSSSSEEDEIVILKSKKLALYAILELQTKHSDLREEVDRLSQTVDKNELFQNLVLFERENLYGLQEEIKSFNLIKDSLIRSSLIKKEDNGTCVDATVNFSNMNMRSEIVKLESKIKNFEQDLYFLAKKPIENDYMLKKTKKLMKKKWENVSNRPQPPVVQKFKNDKLMKKINFFQEDNDRISIDRTVFDEFESLSSQAKKCQNDFYNLKDNLNNFHRSKTIFDEDSIFLNDDNFLMSNDDSNEKDNIELENIPTRSEVLIKMDDLNDDYTNYMNQIERIIGHQNQEALFSKRRSINRQRRHTNRLLAAAFECGEELKESLEIEDEVLEEAVQRGIAKSDALSANLFDLLQKREMAKTIDEKCGEIMRDDDRLAVDATDKEGMENGVCALEKCVRAALGGERCAQLERIASLRKQVMEMKGEL